MSALTRAMASAPTLSPLATAQPPPIASTAISTSTAGTSTRQPAVIIGVRCDGVAVSSWSSMNAATSWRGMLSLTR